MLKVAFTEGGCLTWSRRTLHCSQSGERECVCQKQPPPANVKGRPSMDLGADDPFGEIGK
jgi:hypothetical protein